MQEVAQHVPAVIQSLAPVVISYGYLGVGGLLFLEDFGIPVPGETVLIAAAFFAGLGELNIYLVCLVGIIAAILGDNVGFAIGQYGGHPLVEKFGKYIFLTPQRIKKVEDFFSRHGGQVVIIARFVSGLRQANGIIAGLSEMKWLRFIIFNSIGAVIWVGFWSAVGYLGGNNITTFLHYQLYFTVAVIVFLIGYFGFQTFRKKSTIAV